MLFRKLWRTMGLYRAQFISMILMITLGVGVFFGFNIDFYIHFGLKGYASLFFDRKTPWGKWEQS